MCVCVCTRCPPPLPNELRTFRFTWHKPRPFTISACDRYACVCARALMCVRVCARAMCVCHTHSLCASSSVLCYWRGGGLRGAGGCTCVRSRVISDAHVLLMCNCTRRRLIIARTNEKPENAKMRLLALCACKKKKRKCVLSCKHCNVHAHACACVCKYTCI